MIVSFKGRTVRPGDRVAVYLNLHKTQADGKPWYSLRKDGKVVAHADSLTLLGARFVVNEAGRQRVIAERRKNVHAHVEGILAAEDFEATTPVRYNPYETPTFVTESGPIHGASVARFDGPLLAVA